MMQSLVKVAESRQAWCLLVITACSFVGGLSRAETPRRIDPVRAAAAMDEVFGRLAQGQRPGCAVGVASSGRVIAVRGYGMANLETGTPITPDSVFRIASTSKQFVAASAALLALRGQLDLDADVRTYVPELQPMPLPFSARQLIGHSSGLPDVYPPLELMFGDEDGNFYPSEYTLQMIYRARETIFPPGERYEYSNSGYLLLAQVVERISGDSIRRFIERELLVPLGMTHSHVHDDYREIVPHRATGYGAIGGDGSRGWEIRETNFHVVGDDGLFTTVGDLVTWYEQFHKPTLPDGERLFGLMTTPALYRQGRALDNRDLPADYAFGNLLQEEAGRRIIWHPGGFAGFRAVPVHWPAEDLTVVALCNYRSMEPIDLVFTLGNRLLSDP